LNNIVNISFLLLALLAEIIGTIGGFGSSVFFVPIANFYFDFQTVLGLTALFHLSSNLSKIGLFRKGINKRLIIYMGIPAIVFVIIGGILTHYFDSKILELSLSIFLISLSLLFIVKPKLKINDGNKEAVVGGVLSGFLAGFLGTGGAVRGLTMAAFNLEKSVFIATSAFIDFGVDFSRTVVYFFNGYIQKSELIYIPFLFVIGFVGTYLGKRILTKISQERFKLYSLILILIIGIVTLVGVYY
jgi:uncharacterized membrane protein YfcA